MYCAGLGFSVLARFADHDGFDGTIVGHEGQSYHLEFTTRRGHRATDAPDADHLLVFYIPEIEEWQACCARMTRAGFRAVESLNPFWDRQGRTFEDPDRYRVVIQNSAWPH
jgi:hypothetical protein